MPPKVKYDRQDVLDAAFAIAREQGAEAVNARAVAKRLGCSTQPLFRAFSSMEEIREELPRMALALYASRIEESVANASLPYKGSGMAYIRFAKDEPELFKLLFMCERGGQRGEDDASLESVLGALMKRTGLARDRARNLHLQLWVFAHGLAAMVATKFIEYDETLISALLTEEFEGMRAREAALHGDPPPEPLS